MNTKKRSKKYAKKVKKCKDIYLQVITMIDQATGLIEICSVLEGRVDLVSNQVDIYCIIK